MSSYTHHLKNVFIYDLMYINTSKPKNYRYRVQINLEMMNKHEDEKIKEHK